MSPLIEYLIANSAYTEEELKDFSQEELSNLASMYGHKGVPVQRECFTDEHGVIHYALPRQ